MILRCAQKTALLAICLVGLSIFAASADAGLFDDDEARARIEALNADFEKRINQELEARQKLEQRLNQEKELRAQEEELRAKNEYEQNELIKDIRRQLLSLNDRLIAQRAEKNGINDELNYQLKQLQDKLAILTSDDQDRIGILSKRVIVLEQMTQMLLQQLEVHAQRNAALGWPMN